MKYWIVVALVAAIVGAIACSVALASTREVETRNNVPREMEPRPQAPEPQEPEDQNAPREPTECPPAEEEQEETAPSEEQVPPPTEPESSQPERGEEGPPSEKLTGVATPAKLHITQEVLDSSEAFLAAGVQDTEGGQLLIFLFQEGDEEDNVDLIVEGNCQVFAVWWQDGSGSWQSAEVCEKGDEEDSDEMNFFFKLPESVITDEAKIWIDCSSSPDP